MPVPSPPTRPALRARYDARRREVVATAAKLFAERGYDGTSIGAVIGGILLLELPDAVFDAIVPALILLAVALMALRPVAAEELEFRMG